MSAERSRENTAVEIIRMMEVSPLSAAERFGSGYPNDYQAFLELVDNAADNRKPGQIERVYIQLGDGVNLNTILISNRGGVGLGEDGLRKYLRWGFHEGKEGEIGRFGVGGKAAAVHLGKGVDLVCHAAGEPFEYRLQDPHWNEKGDVNAKDHSVEKRPVTDSAQVQEGYFMLKITELKPEAQAALKTGILVSKLGDDYRFLLANGSISINVRDVKKKQSIEVKPIELPYMDTPGFEPVNLEINTPFGLIPFTVGFIDEEKQRELPESQRSKPGFRLLLGGRTIDRGHFPKSSNLKDPALETLPNALRLLGEIHLDQVEPTVYKGKFNEGSRKFQDAMDQIFLVLRREGILSKLTQLPGRSSIEVERFERDLVLEIKTLIDRILKDSPTIHDLETTGIAMAAGRQRHPVVHPTGNLGTGETGQPNPHPNKERKPVDVPDFGTRKMVTHGLFSQTEIEPMSEDGPPFRVVDNQGQRLLRFNPDYSGYQHAKQLGVDTLRTYLIIKSAEAASEVLIGSRQGEGHAPFVECQRVIERAAFKAFAEKKSQKGGTIRFN